MRQSTRPAGEGAEMGDPAPGAGQDGGGLVLRRLEGPGVKLGNFAGKNLLVIFGSYSDPTFRDRAAGLPGLLRRVGRRVDVLMVYSAELFPAGVAIGRNEAAGVSVAGHRTIEERLAAAKSAAAELKLSGLVWCVDDMDGSAAKSFGLAYPTPAGAVLIGRDGRVARVNRYLDLYAIEEAVLGLPPKVGATTAPTVGGDAAGATTKPAAEPTDR